METPNLNQQRNETFQSFQNQQRTPAYATNRRNPAHTPTEYELMPPPPINPLAQFNLQQGYLNYYSSLYSYLSSDPRKETLTRAPQTQSSSHTGTGNRNHIEQRDNGSVPKDKLPTIKKRNKRPYSKRSEIINRRPNFKRQRINLNESNESHRSSSSETSETDQKKVQMDFQKALDSVGFKNQPVDELEWVSSNDERKGELSELEPIPSGSGTQIANNNDIPAPDVGHLSYALHPDGPPVYCNVEQSEPIDLSRNIERGGDIHAEEERWSQSPTEESIPIPWFQCHVSSSRGPPYPIPGDWVYRGSVLPTSVFFGYGYGYS